MKMKKKYVFILVPIFVISFLTLKMSITAKNFDYKSNYPDEEVIEYVGESNDEPVEVHNNTFIHSRVVLQTNSNGTFYFNEKYLRIAKLADPDGDSKNIVDRPSKKPLSEVLQALEELDESNQTAAIDFMQTYFHEPGFDILTYNSSDHFEIPDFINRLNLTRNLTDFTLSINSIWSYLYRRFDSDKFNGTEFTSSHIPMKHPFIVPGGRFIEIYYWDTYWTIEGLLVCDMFESAKMMLENFIDFIQRFGFIPNGSRIYYLNRSQPPYFSKMVSLFYDKVKNSTELSETNRNEYIEFVLDVAVDYMIEEYHFWMTRRAVNVQKNGVQYTLNTYGANDKNPRAESYSEDMALARNMTKEDSEQLFLDITAAAESGYDFSSRWFENETEIRTIQTTSIIPTDLNSLLYETEIIIAKFADLKGDQTTSIKFHILAAQRQKAINTILWSKTHLEWCDYNMKTGRLNDRNFYVTNLSPLWSGIKPPSYVTVERIIETHREKFLRYDGGMPVSYVNDTSQQWDFPNVWAPNQHSMVLMLLKYDYNLALRVAKQFFNSVYVGYNKHGEMFEKYLATEPGERGHGGEYKAQFGFGWTNGVTLSFISIFKNNLIE